MKIAPFFGGFAVAVTLFSLDPPSPRPAAAAPDNTFGMALLSAAVSSSGTLVRGSGAIGASRTTTGQYTVQFDRDVLNCFMFISLSADGGVDQSGETRATTIDGLPNLIFVGTKDSAGAAGDRSFNLMVFCNK